MHTQELSPRVRAAAFIASGAALVLGLAVIAPAAAVGHGHGHDHEHDGHGNGHRHGRPGHAAPYTHPDSRDAFHRLATYPVFGNAPAGVDPAAETVAEISDVSEDGNTVVYTDAAGRRIGFLDISDPANPRGAGSLSLAELGNTEDEPTSVAVVGGYVLVVVNTSESYTSTSGRLDVVDLNTRTRVRSIDLGGQPDSIAITPDGAHAVVAIENERDEDAPADGVTTGENGDLPQAPAGFVQIVDLPEADPSTWTTREVSLTDGAASATLTSSGIDTPQDPEPEYVAIDPSGTTAAVTLQENNGIVLIDIASGEVTAAYSAGSQALTGVDTADDGVIDLTGSLRAAPREPDAITWLDDTHVATANEGDWKGGTRGWSVFDASTGEVVWDAGNELEHLAARTGLHNDDRAGKKGVEIEGITSTVIDGVPYAFVGSERSNFVAVYDVSDPAAPRFVQVLATTNGPEGLLPVPERDLLVVSSEEDDAEDGVRSAITVFAKGRQFARAAGTPQFPSIVSDDDAAGAPIGWTALGALSADPHDKRQLWAASDSAESPASIYSVRLDGRGGRTHGWHQGHDGRHHGHPGRGNAPSAPAVIDREITVSDNGVPADLDIEGLWARPDGGFWLASEGATGPQNELVRIDRDGVVRERVTLPADVAAGLGKWGLEGISGLVDGEGEHLFVALQRGLTTDDGLGGFARIGRYDVATGQWAWFGYPLEQSSGDGDWIGLSEVTVVDRDTLAVVERDKLNGPDAALKAVYTVDLPETDPTTGDVAMLDKELAIDVLPRLRATNGWTQEKLEGLTIGGDGHVYAVTDNDAVDDATGETVFLDLGKAKRLRR